MERSRRPLSLVRPVAKKLKREVTEREVKQFILGVSSHRQARKVRLPPRRGVARVPEVPLGRGPTGRAVGPEWARAGWWSARGKDRTVRSLRMGWRIPCNARWKGKSIGVAHRFTTVPSLSLHPCIGWDVHFSSNPTCRDNGFLFPHKIKLHHKLQFQISNWFSVKPALTSRYDFLNYKHTINSCNLTLEINLLKWMMMLKKWSRGRR